MTPLVGDEKLLIVLCVVVIFFIELLLMMMMNFLSFLYFKTLHNEQLLFVLIVLFKIHCIYVQTILFSNIFIASYF